MKKRALSLALAGAMVVTTLAAAERKQGNNSCTGRNNSGDNCEGRGTGGYDGCGFRR